MESVEYLARASNIYKRQTRPLVREGAPQKQDRRLDAKTYWLTYRQSQYDFDFDFESVELVELSELVTEESVSCCSVFVSCCCEELAAEAGDSSGTQKKGNVRSLKPLSNNGYWKPDCGH
jgi:hypothetical protein